MAGKQCSTEWLRTIYSLAMTIVLVTTQGLCTCTNSTLDYQMTAIGHRFLEYAAAQEFPSTQVSNYIMHVYT